MESVSIRTAQRQRKAAGIARPPGPAPSSGQLKRACVAIDAATYQIVADAGNGNFTEGVRALAKYFSDNLK